MTVDSVQTECENLKRVNEVARLIRSSLGPVSRDKLIIMSTGELLVTSDGRTLLERMFSTTSQQEVSIRHHPMHSLIVNLSRNQDIACGDGTTSVVVLCGEMCAVAMQLLERGIHPLTIIEGYRVALRYALEQLSLCAVERLDQNSESAALMAARTSLNTKLVSRNRDHFARLCVDAVTLVKNIRFISMEYLESSRERSDDDLTYDSELIHGIMLKKAFSHDNMSDEITDARIAVLSCPLEPPRPKTKHTVNIGTRKDFEQLHQVEEHFFQQIFDKLLQLNVTTVICQWGMDHEVNEWLRANNIIGIRWVPGHELERVAMAVGAKICPRITELEEDMLGSASRIYQKKQDKANAVFIEGCHNPMACTIVVRATSELIAEDIIRSLNDALCNVRDCMQQSNEKVLAGGGASEAEIYCKTQSWAYEYIEQREREISEQQKSGGSEMQLDLLYQHLDVIQGWSRSLLCIPYTLAENAGTPNCLELIQDLLDLHKQPDHQHFGVAISGGTSEPNDMTRLQVYESLKLKRSVWQLATEMCCMILKIDQVIMD